MSMPIVHHIYKNIETKPTMREIMKLGKCEMECIRRSPRKEIELIS